MRHTGTRQLESEEYSRFFLPADILKRSQQAVCIKILLKRFVSFSQSDCSPGHGLFQLYRLWHELLI